MRSHTDGVVMFVEQPEGFHPNPDGQTNQFSWAEGNHLKLFGCKVARDGGCCGGDAG